MTSPLWQRSDGELLKALREKAGLDPAVLARMGTMTVHQLRGLEDGEGGEFYSPAIKAHMGRVLLAKLGYVAPPPEGAASQASSLAPAADPAPARESLPRVSHAPVQPRVQRREWPLGFVAAGASVLAIGGWFLLGARAPSPPVPAAGPPPQVTVATLAPATPAAPATAAAAPATAAAAAAQAGAEPACIADADRPSLTFTPAEPRKSGNFVHLVADKPVQLCVLDASQKAVRVQLDPGVGRSIPGAPPFVVRGELGHLKIFFQGVRVQGDLASGTQLVLNEAPLR